MKLVLATRSPHKLREIRAILSGVPDLELLDLDQAGVPEEPALEDRLEPYDTFEENARSKAVYFRRLTGLWSVADDSGIVVDALGGAPGVRSRRFAPVPPQTRRDEQDRANNAHLLRLLADVGPERRAARYVCVAALAEGEGRVETFRGTAEGIVAEAESGGAGFGYDPLFFDPELGRTFAEIGPAEKDARSHRGRAFRALAEHLARRGAGAGQTDRPPGGRS